MVALVGVTGPARADGPASGDAITTVGASPSTQSAHWSRADKRLRLYNYASSGMSSNRCIDILFDWRTSGGHYDSRTLRNCRPGGTVRTDPSGDGWWSENWGPRSITGVRIVSSAVISDSTLERVGEQENVHGAMAYPRPATQGQWSSRVRTLYESGSTATTQNSAKPYPCDRNSTLILGRCVL